MQIESSNNSKDDNFSQSLRIEKENIICKDGFCTLPNQNENPNISKNNVNLFDPIWFKDIHKLILFKKVCLSNDQINSLCIRNFWMPIKNFGLTLRTLMARPQDLIGGKYN